MPQHRKPDPIKHCEQCKTPMTRKRYGGTLESMNVLNRRKFCDQICMGLAHTHSEPTRAAVQKRVRRFPQLNCEDCGRKEHLSIHHQDRNWRNNHPANLRTLCMSCHTSLHHRQGDLITKVVKPPCGACGKPSYRLGLCHTHLTRFKRHGSPYLTKIKTGAAYQLVEDRGTPNGPELAA